MPPLLFKKQGFSYRLDDSMALFRFSRSDTAMFWHASKWMLIRWINTLELVKQMLEMLVASLGAATAVSWGEVRF